MPDPFMTRPLSEVLAVIESGSRPTGGVTEVSSGIPSIGGENIQREGSLNLQSVRRVPASFYRAMPRGHLRVGDVLINKDGAQTGKVGYYAGEFLEASINEHVFLLRGRPESIHQKFLFWALLMESTQRDIARHITGSAQPGLAQGFVRNVEIPLPLPSDQRRIASALDRVDHALAATEAILQKLRQVRQGLLHDLLTRGLDGNGELRDPVEHPEEFEDSPLGGIPRAWDIRTLEEVTDADAPICYGIVQAFEYISDGVPVLAIRDLLGDFVTGVHRTAPSIDAAYARSRVRPGDVLISIKGTIGRIGLVPSHYLGNISRDLARIRPADSVFAPFLVHLLRSSIGKRTLDLAQVGTTRAELSIAPLKKLSFSFPPKDEQTSIASVLDVQDRVIASQESQLAKIRVLKSGLISDLVSGCVRASETRGGTQ